MKTKLTIAIIVLASALGLAQSSQPRHGVVVLIAQPDFNKQGNCLPCSTSFYVIDRAGDVPLFNTNSLAGATADLLDGGFKMTVLPNADQFTGITPLMFTR